LNSDFRGPNGVWTLREKGKLQGRVVDKYYPTLSHYAVTELARRGLVKYVISTNMDALHFRSGLPGHLLNEQHGNKHKERCEKCAMEFFRQYDTLETVTSTRSHLTGRNCTFCGGRLRDTIVHFSEPVKPEDMMLAMYNARKSDLAVVIGTSMNVQPAASFPDKCFKNGGKLVIINLQKTPYDSLASIRIFAKCDDVMRMLMEELTIYEFSVTTDIIDTWDPKPQSEHKKERDPGIMKDIVVWSSLAISAFGALSCGYLLFRSMSGRSS
jgi:NAD+-dependent protein deacetylase sirtuin 6